MEGSGLSSCKMGKAVPTGHTPLEGSLLTLGEAGEPGAADLGVWKPLH